MQKGSGCSSKLGEIAEVVEIMEGCISRVEARGGVKLNVSMVKIGLGLVFTLTMNREAIKQGIVLRAGSFLGGEQTPRYRKTFGNVQSDQW